MSQAPRTVLAVLAAAVLILGCASETYLLMPTPVLYQEPSAASVILQPQEVRGSSTDVDLLYVTDRGPETDAASNLPYGETRAKSIAFGSARVEIGPGVSWETLDRESRLAERTRELNLSLGRVAELGRFPDEPYGVELRAEDVPMELQRYLAPLDKVDVIIYEGPRTDAHGHFYFTTNPRVSSDVIQLLRYGRKPGDPGRELIKVAPIVWKFPQTEK